MNVRELVEQAENLLVSIKALEAERERKIQDAIPPEVAEAVSRIEETYNEAIEELKAQYDKIVAQLREEAKRYQAPIIGSAIRVTFEARKMVDTKQLFSMLDRDPQLAEKLEDVVYEKQITRVLVNAKKLGGE